MDNRKELIDFEAETDLSKITENGVWIYPVIRQNLNTYAFLDIKSDKAKLSKFDALKKILQSVKWNLRNKKLSRTDILLFDSANSRRLFPDGKRRSIFSSFLDKLDFSYLIVERPSDYRDNRIGNRKEINYYYPDLDVLKILLRSKLFSRRHKKVSNKEFNSLKSKFKLDNNFNGIVDVKLNRFWGFVEFYEKLIQKTNPKLIFIVCGYYYSYMALCYVAKKHSVPTIELQHGLINESHTGYIYKNVCEKKLFPDYLFSFSQKNTDMIERETKMFEAGKIKTIGYPFLDEFTAEKNQDKKIKTIYITSQWTIREQLKNFTEKLAEILPEKFIIKYKTHPGENNIKEYYSSFSNYANIKLIDDPDKNSIEIMADSDYHSTVYSTSYMEAFYFHLPNIFIEIEGYSDAIKKEIDNKSSFIVNTPEEYIKVLDRIELNFTDIKNELIKRSENYYRSNPIKNLQQEIKNIIDAE